MNDPHSSNTSPADPSPAVGQMATEFLAPPPVAVSLDPAASRPTSPTPAGPRPDRDFHGLKVHGMLGEGGMGAAFLASHKVLRVPLVIKTFKSAAPAQIFREAHLAARVSSPHVVSVLDAGVEDGVPFVVQRYVDGIDLEELLKAQRAIGRRLPVDLVCRLVLDAAMGLRAIHQAGVIHRDVKPANLFLGGNGTASVGDFGIAVETLSGNAHEPIVGTPQFMAPEQWNQGVIDRRTDLYALGATAHLLSTNVPPFHGESALLLGVAHVSEPYIPPIPRDPREAYLFAVVGRMLRKRPDERYASADEVVRSLGVVTEPGARIIPQEHDHALIGEVRVELVVGDIAEQQVDVIVSAANTQLKMDRGVALSLLRAGGEEVAAEARAQRELPVAMGDVVWTSAGRLSARHVAHAVAALDGAICLQRCVLRVLLEAEARKATTVALPALGTGVGEVPMAQGAKLILEAFRTFAWVQPQHVRLLRVVLFKDADRDCWRDVLQSM